MKVTLIMTFVFSLWPALLIGPVITIASLSWVILLITGQLHN